MLKQADGSVVFSQTEYLNLVALGKTYGFSEDDLCKEIESEAHSFEEDSLSVSVSVEKIIQDNSKTTFGAFYELSPESWKNVIGDSKETMIIYRDLSDDIIHEIRKALRLTTLPYEEEVEVSKDKWMFVTYHDEAACVKEYQRVVRYAKFHHQPIPKFLTEIQYLDLMRWKPR